MDYFSFVPTPTDFSVDMVTSLDGVAVLVLYFIHVDILTTVMAVVAMLMMIIMMMNIRSRPYI